VLAQRYLAERANPSYAELAQWMQSYADHPDAMAIYQLAERKRPRRNAAALRRPAAAERLNPEIELIDDLQPPPEQAAPPGRANLGAQTHAATALMARLRARVRTGRASELEGAAEQLRHAESRQLLSEGQIDFVATLIAASWMAESNDARALELAQPAAQRSGALVPRATWIAGLAFFKQGRFAEAARSFEAMARVRACRAGTAPGPRSGPRARFCARASRRGSIPCCRSRPSSRARSMACSRSGCSACACRSISTRRRSARATPRCCSARPPARARWR
jgi:hypothetical protein